MNKKSIIGIIVMILLIAVIGVIYITSSNSNNGSSSNEFKELENQTPNKVEGTSKSLVVYFSVPETDNAENMTRDEDNSVTVVDGKVLGNTEYVANLISDKTNSDLFRLEPVDAYPTNHQELLKRASEEMENDVRPEIKDQIDISDYDTIFIGYPIWNDDLPPIINTFLENNDFNGKTIIPFCTHGGSGLSGTPTTIKNKLSDSKVITNGFSISRSNMESADSNITSWLKGIGF